jgi:hypothetical protein
MKKGYTHISILLDASSSMSSLRETVIDGINKLIEEQKLVPGAATVSLAQFADTHHTIFTGKNLLEQKKLTTEDYRPMGSTALIDSFYVFIEQTGKFLSDLKEEDRPENVIFIVFTDGEENRSFRYTREQLKAAVDEQTNKYSWKFIFLGANIDAFAAGAGYGTKGVQFNSTPTGMARSLSYASAYTASSRMGNTKDTELLASAASVDSVKEDVERIKNFLNKSADKS